MNPYHALLRTNRNFRLLFIGQTVSQLGDWFSAIAVYALLLDLTGSATSVAWMMIAQFLPYAIVGPVAGCKRPCLRNSTGATAVAHINGG